MSECERHEGRCAYNGTEADRCPHCHSLWSVILACPHEGCGSRSVHQAMHARNDVTRQKGIDRKRRAAAALRAKPAA